MATNERQKRGRRAAALHLRVLLLKQGAYRERWETYAHDIKPGEINQSAVCQVIAQHLWDTGERSEADIGLPRKLKDRIGRALIGRELSLETLRWLVAGFELSSLDAQRVQELYRADTAPRTIAGNLPPRAALAGVLDAVERAVVGFSWEW